MQPKEPMYLVIQNEIIQKSAPARCAQGTGCPPKVSLPRSMG